MRRVGRALVVGFVMAGQPGCGHLLDLGWPSHRPAPPPALAPPHVVADEDEIPWARDEPVFVIVRLSCRTLDVYRRGRRIRTYESVAGMGGSGKQFEGDRRTPIGLYEIVGKYPHPRWRWFLRLDYPNPSDLVRYEEAVAAGDVPESDNGARAGIGSAIGIHGTDKPDDNRRGIDWTWGCVSVENRAIEDLVRLLPLGTPVLIRE